MTRALFLDRDGVINVEKNYVYKIKDFIFNEGIFELCKYYKRLNYKIFVITNQSGVARGHYTLDDLEVIHNWMLSQFLINEIIIDKIYFCPHHPEFDLECDCRKPAPGMILKAKEEFNISLSTSVLIGDRKSDIEAGRLAGILDLNLIHSNNLRPLLNKLNLSN